MKPVELSNDLNSPQLLRYRLMSFIRTLFIALFPAIVFLIFQLTPWHINEPIRDYVVIGLIIWGLLAFISAFDPTFNTKITAIKDIMSIFPSRTDHSS
jgi:hypothetical protein